MDAPSAGSNLQLLKSWRANCRRSQVANYNAANRFSRQHYWIGIPAAILAAVAGTSVFVNLQEMDQREIRILVGVTSLIAAALSTIQTLLHSDERSAKHRATAAGYAAVKRELDQMIADAVDGNPLSPERMNMVRMQMDSLAREAPEMPDGIWKAALDEVERIPRGDDVRLEPRPVSALQAVGTGDSESVLTTGRSTRGQKDQQSAIHPHLPDRS